MATSNGVEGTTAALRDFPKDVIQPHVGNLTISPDVTGAHTWQPPEFLADAGVFFGQQMSLVALRLGDWHGGLQQTKQFYDQLLPLAADRYEELVANAVKAINPVAAAAKGIDDLGRNVYATPPN